jgi:two-component system, NarL family, sensor histidine kinase DesK
MTPARLLQALRDPPPDSLVGLMTRADGRVMRTMPFVILFNLAWVFFWPVIARQSFVHVILPTLISVPVFVWLHLCTYYTGGGMAARRRYIAGVVALGYLVSYFNLAALGYLIFSFFTAAFSLSMRGAFVWIGATIAGYLLEVALLGNNTQTLLSVALPAVLLGISAVYTAYTTMQQARLRRSTEEITRLATLAERERIGRDLHDLLGHTLSVVALKSELARKLIDRDLDAARTEIGEVERVARDALSQVRNAVSGIRSTAIAAELQAAISLLEAQGVKVKCETERVKLPHDRETALALSLREATTNIHRHADASGVTIKLREDSGKVVMEVVDNGRGGRIIPGNGLNGMRERLGNVGGTLSLEAVQDGGTRLFVSIPSAA